MSAFTRNTGQGSAGVDKSRATSRHTGTLFVPMMIDESAGASAAGQAGLQGFQSRKESALGKRDKSKAGRIDPRAVEICAAINNRLEYFTTSSCAGRCFMYRGDGIKSHHHFAPGTEATADSTNDMADGRQGLGYFERFRVSHDIIRNSSRYFDLSTLDPSDESRYDPTGGGDPVRSIGQFQHAQLQKRAEGEEVECDAAMPTHLAKSAHVAREGAIWLRFEPFILHVMCRSLSAASALMAAARPSFKNVGLTSFKHGFGRYVVAIWGDEGLDMPLTWHDDCTTAIFARRENWLADLINERHKRNWAKIGRFVTEVRNMPAVVDDVDGWCQDSSLTMTLSSSDVPDSRSAAPKRFDVVGDVAILNNMPPGTTTEKEAVGNAIMARNKAIKVCVARVSTLSGIERAPGESLITIAGAKRSPLITTHQEYGIKCVVDLENTFFSPRMGPERLRICQQVARGEKVLVLFCGVGIDCLQIAGRTEAESVIAIELNPAAAECARRGKRLLERNKAVKTLGAAERLKIIEGDVTHVLPTLDRESFDRIVAPRPKEGALDGDLGLGDGGAPFLEQMLPVLRPMGGELHWYDFVADHELPGCDRTRKTLERGCDKCGVSMEVLHVAQVGSIAKRQFRVCMDVRLAGRK